MIVYMLNITGKQELIFICLTEIKVNHLLIAKIDINIVNLYEIDFNHIASEYGNQFIWIERVNL